MADCFAQVYAKITPMRGDKREAVLTSVTHMDFNEWTAFCKVCHRFCYYPYLHFILCSSIIQGGTPGAAHVGRCHCKELHVSM